MRSVDVAFLGLLSAFRTHEGRKPSTTASGGWQGAPGTSAFWNYLIVAPGPGAMDGPLNDPDSEVDRDYTVQCVAATADGAAILAGNVVNAVRGRRIETATRITTRPITVERWGPVDPDDTVQPPVFVVAHVFSVPTVPVISGS